MSVGVNILLNETSIQALNFVETTYDDEKSKRHLTKVSFDFQVTSNEYHDITTLLYTNNFEVKIAERDLQFQATIENYATSITNLYKDKEVGLFHLELVEK